MSNLRAGQVWERQTQEKKASILLLHFSAPLITRCQGKTPSDYLFALLHTEAITTNRPAGCWEHLGVINQWAVRRDGMEGQGSPNMCFLIYHLYSSQ